MTWLLMCTGREHSLTAAAHPDNAPSLAEMAHALAHINRYTGHACRPYSVAEHSLLCADIAHAMGATKLQELCALMHDAHECITGDVASPIKQVLGSAWALFEDAQHTNVLLAFDLLEPMQANAALVKTCDLVALATERRDLLPWDATHHAPWPVIDTPGHEVHPWASATLMQPSHVLRTPREWTRKFLMRADTLMQAVDTHNTTISQPANRSTST